MVSSSSIKIRKEAIIEKAQTLFLERGYDETSISQIAKALDIAKGLLYYYFDTKEEILVAVVDRMCERQLSALVHKMDVSYVDFSMALVLLIEEYSNFRAKAIRRHEECPQYESRLFAEYHRQYLLKMHDVIEKVVYMGIEEAKLTVNYPYEMVVMVLEGAYHLEYFENIHFEDKLRMIETALHLKSGNLSRAIIRLKDAALIYGGDMV